MIGRSAAAKAWCSSRSRFSSAWSRSASLRRASSECKKARAKRWCCCRRKAQLFTQAVAQELMRRERIVLICGRYEGVDERVSEYLADREISVGDFVLSGGELGAAIIIDAMTRLVPGALGNAASAQQESFTAIGGRADESGSRRAAEFDLRFGRIAGLSALHAAGRVSRDAGSRGAGEWEPR